MLRDLFHETVTFAGILGVDTALSVQLTAKAAKLPPFLIGAGGQLQEWLTGTSLLSPFFSSLFTPFFPTFSLSLPHFISFSFCLHLLTRMPRLGFAGTLSQSAI